MCIAVLRGDRRSGIIFSGSMHGSDPARPTLYRGSRTLTDAVQCSLLVLREDTHRGVSDLLSFIFYGLFVFPEKR